MSRQTRSTAKRLTRVLLSTPPINPPLRSTQSSQLETRLFATPQEWESYLTDNHLTNPSGLWLKIAKKSCPTPSITYDQALDTALCHGWIDGQRKSLDETHFIQRFTPRRKGSLWSQRNVKKVDMLIAEGKMKPAGQTEIDAAREDGRWERAYSSSSNATVPEDFQKALDENKAAGDFFAGLGKTKKYVFIQRLETAKKPETRSKRIEQFLTLLASEKSL
ncbi:bacteriocin-protection, YdeI or OmpD-associated-domain-containing protein [Fusarium venenatum]|uniref:bacteriocin-protection, YdeI or OmpD-associated-domain-containing protein n=1 Tax=Fusarium venenatum TaxID=56646 RepID=UPI001D4E6B5A|nr:bacteriocin-protection, YdeI or OmpD-associated-domain-containing protein [Fusarium venenatum]